MVTLVTQGDVAAMAGASRHAVRRAALAHGWRVVRVGRQVAYVWDDVAPWVACPARMSSDTLSA